MRRAIVLMLALATTTMATAFATEEEKKEKPQPRPSFIGHAHWYGKELHGRRTASGAVFDREN